MPDQALPGPNLRVLVADDNPVVRAGLAALLDGHPDLEVVAQAADGEEAIAAATRLRPDVVLLDVRMPGTDGLTALPALSLLAPVMMLTYSREPEVVAEALRRGAVGYLVHGEFTAAELISAVREVRHAKATVPDSLGVLYEPNDFPSHLQLVVGQSSKVRSGFAARLHRRVPSRLQLRPEFTGGGGHGSHRVRHEQSADRRRLLHQREDRQEPHQPHLRKAAQFLAQRSDRPLAGHGT